MNAWDHIAEAEALTSQGHSSSDIERFNFDEGVYKLAQTHVLIAIAQSLADLADLADQDQ